MLVGMDDICNFNGYLNVDGSWYLGFLKENVFIGWRMELYIGIYIFVYINE